MYSDDESGSVHLMWRARPLEVLVFFGAHDVPMEQHGSSEAEGRAKFAGFFFRDDSKERLNGMSYVAHGGLGPSSN